MSADGNINAVKSIYDAFGQGDVAAILDSVTDDVDWAAEAASDLAPWYGERSGKDGVASFFEDIASALDVLEFSPLSYAANASEVMTRVRFRLRSKVTGREAAMNLHHYWRFRDGKVDYYRGSEDTAQTVSTIQS